MLFRSNTDTKLHPLLALVSVLGGIQTLGLWGVFIGPIVASCLYALVRIFNTELFALSRERFGMALGEGSLLGSGLAAMDRESPPAPPVLANPSPSVAGQT